MEINDVSGIILDTAFKLQTGMGPGLLESAYEQILYEDLIELGLKVERQVSLPIIWKGKVYEHTYRADLIVENIVIVELKSKRELDPIDYKQLLTYLRLSQLEVGLLINFGEAYFKKGVKRIVNNYKGESLS